jgi:hypothetical protein
MNEHTAESDACQAAINYQPLDLRLSARIVRCTRPAWHLGLHRGDDGLPFGPAVTSVNPSGVSDGGDQS